MGYIVELLVDERIPEVGHAFLRFTNENGSSFCQGFYPNENEATINYWFKPIIGNSKAIIKDEITDGILHEYTRGKIFDITEEQYNTMLNRIEEINININNGTTTYDLFDGDSGTSDFNCVTFVEHILNMGGIEVELGLIPHIALSYTYPTNEFGERYYDNLSININENAKISYNNGYVLYSDGSWEHHTTMPSYSITTIYNDVNKSLTLSVDNPINNGFISSFLNLAQTLNITHIDINNSIYNVSFNDNKMVLDEENTIDMIFKSINEESSSLLGNNGNDILITNDGNDYLEGGLGSDTMYGGEGLDIYYSNNGDTIEDSDNYGKIIFENIELKGGLYNSISNTFEEKNGETLLGNYTIVEKDLIFTDVNGNILTIKNYFKENNSISTNLNINLKVSFEDIEVLEEVLQNTVKFQSNNDIRNSECNIIYSLAQLIIIRADPLVLDLNNDGVISTISYENSNVFFNIDSDIEKEKIGWISPEDGILVDDINANGTIDGIEELFGDKTNDGFSQLKTKYDSNNDNIINNQDTKFNQLKVWQDLNGDGITQIGELKTLNELGITSLNTTNTNTNILDNGNVIFKTSTFTQNGIEKLSGDVNLKFSETLTSNPLNNNNTISYTNFSLPWIRGFGGVEDTHVAYENNSLFFDYTKNLINDIVGENLNLETVFKTKFEMYVRHWTGLEKLFSNCGMTRENLMIEDKIWILEKYTGQKFLTDSIEHGYWYHSSFFNNSVNTNYVEETYQQFLKETFIPFSIQTTLKDVFNGSYYSMNLNSLVIEDSNALKSSLLNYLNQELSLFDKELILNTLNKYKNLITFSNEEINSINDFFIKESLIFIKENEANISFNGKNIKNNENNIVFNSDSGMTINDNSGKNLIFANDGNDIINVANSIVNTGKGNDKVYSGGNSILKFNIGDGNDIFHTYSSSDIVEFGNGITIETIKGMKVVKPTMHDSSYYSNSSDLILEIDNENSIRFVNFYSTSTYYSAQTLPSFKFADGTTLGATEILNLVPTILDGTLNGDLLNGNVGKDIINGLDGNDSIYGKEGEDTLYGNNGNDKLYGGDGNDNLHGGDGNDFIYGEFGDDIINSGNGDDIIEDMNGINIIDSGDGNDKIYLINSILSAGKGNDKIYSYGNNILKFNIGDGNDILQYFTTNDVIELGDGILKENVTIERTSTSLCETSYLVQYANDLIIRFNSEDSIRLVNVFTTNSYYNPTQQTTPKLKFSDGTLLLPIDVFNLPSIVNGTTNGDNIEGLNGNDVINGLSGNDTINGRLGDDTINGGDGNDNLYGNEGNDIINGDDGNDYIYDTQGNNIISGGSGDDTIYGSNSVLSGAIGNDILISYGNSTFKFNLGDGKDIIGKYNLTDCVEFGEGISISSIKAAKKVQNSGNQYAFDLIIEFYNSDSITFSNYYSSNTYYNPTTNVIPTLKFMDGTTLNATTLLTLPSFVDGTINGDTLDGLNGNDVINGFGGNDTISGRLGDDTINGGDGNDNLWGNEGNDIISGDSGNDSINDTQGNNILNGGNGDDTIYGGNSVLNGEIGNDIIYSYGNSTFKFNLGDGKDIIGKYNLTDCVEFGEGISISSIRNVRKVATGNQYAFNLLVEFNDNDSITFSNYYSTNTYYNPTTNVIPTLKFVDGTTLNATTILTLPSFVDGTINGDILDGLNGNDVINGLGGNDTINGRLGDDTINGGDGNDNLWGNEGNDIISGDAGNDSINDTQGNNIINFKSGDGTDTVYINNTSSINFDELLDKNDISFYKNGTNGSLYIKYSATDEVILNTLTKEVTVGNYYVTQEDINKIIQDMNSFASSNSITISNSDSVRNNENLMMIIENSWKEK